MYWLITHMDSTKRWKVEAGSEKEAVRKWYRYGTHLGKGFMPPTPGITDPEIDEAYISGDLFIEVVPEGDYKLIP